MKAILHISLFLLAAVPLLRASVIEVRPGASIKEAVANARPFDTVMVHGGEYREQSSVDIRVPLTLIGIDYPLVDGENRYQPLSIYARYVSVSGFRISNSPYAGLEDYAGIKVYNTSDIYIWNNRLENNYFAIYLAGSRRCVVSGNHIVARGDKEQTSGNGIHAWKCDSLLIEHNYAKGQRDGIYFEFVTHSRILHNFSEGNLRYGLHFMFSNNDHYEGNTFLHNGAGVAVMYSRYVTMLDNRFLDNRGSSAYGLLLKDITDSRIERNVFQQNTTGIFMEGCSRGNFVQNVFQENGWALKLQASCDDNYIGKNKFFSNTFDMSTNNAIVLNTLDNNYWDKYEGYDLDKNGIGDVPYRPVSLFVSISDNMPYAMMLWRSFMVMLLDRSEKVIPSLTPENLRDDSPAMKP